MVVDEFLSCQRSVPGISIADILGNRLTREWSLTVWNTTLQGWIGAHRILALDLFPFWHKYHWTQTGERAKLSGKTNEGTNNFSKRHRFSNGTLFPWISLDVRSDRFAHVKHHHNNHYRNSSRLQHSLITFTIYLHYLYSLSLALGKTSILTIHHEIQLCASFASIN